MQEERYTASIKYNREPRTFSLQSKIKKSKQYACVRFTNVLVPLLVLMPGENQHKAKELQRQRTCYSD